MTGKPPPAAPADPLERAIAGALRDSINAHGPITPAQIGSAVKRIIGNLRNTKLEALARELGRRRWANVSQEDNATHHSAAGKRAWKDLSPEERSAEMSRRRRKGLEKKAAAADD